jgi:hypothetical protein
MGCQRGSEREMTRQRSSNPKEAEMATTQATQAETARDLLLQIARIQLASITATSKFFTGWAQSADRYVQAVSGELRARIHGDTQSNELAKRLAGISAEHLHELTALPNVAVRHFNKELAAANH